MLGSALGLAENGSGTTLHRGDRRDRHHADGHRAVGIGRGLVDDVAVVRVLVGGLEHRAVPVGRRQGEVAAGVGGGGGVAGVELPSWLRSRKTTRPARPGSRRRATRWR